MDWTETQRRARAARDKADQVLQNMFPMPGLVATAPQREKSSPEKSLAYLQPDFVGNNLVYDSRLIPGRRVDRPSNEEIARASVQKITATPFTDRHLKANLDFIQASFLRPSSAGRPIRLQIIPIELFSSTRIHTLEHLADGPKVFLSAPRYRALVIKTYDNGRFINKRYETMVINDFLPGFQRSNAIYYPETNHSTPRLQELELEILKGRTRDQEYFNAIEAELVKSGQVEQKEVMSSLLAPVFKDYSRRRHFQEEYEQYVSQDSQQMQNLTRYNATFTKDQSGSAGPMMSIMGQMQATYGKIVFFNKKTNQWEEHTGPFGTAHMINHDFFGLVPDLVETPGKMLTHQPVEMIPVEKYYASENIVLPRPAVPDTSAQTLGRGNEFLEALWRKDYNDGIVPDFNQPILFYTGQIVELTKFWVNKEGEDPTALKREVLTNTTKSLFSEHIDDSFITEGTMIYTRGGELEKHLHGRGLGFKPLPIDVPTHNGEPQYILGVTPKSLVETIHRQVTLTDAEALEILKSLEELR